jgi:pimeloyl-ACP methyl ester carboxylesterase
VTDYVERRWASRDGFSLFARDYAGTDGGARLAVICLHGLTRNSKDFDDVAPLIARSGRRVIVPDVRGRGQSGRDPNPANYQPKIYARDVLEMMHLLGIPRAVFVGTSMGGIIIMTLAVLRSKAVAAAILNDVGPAIAPEGVARIMGYVGVGEEIRSWDDAADYMCRTMGVAFPGFAGRDWRRLAEQTFRNGENGPEFDYDPAIAAQLRPPSRLTTMLAWWLFRRLARKRPTLLIRGALSDVLSREIALEMRRQAPSLRLVEVPNVGHAPLLTEPAAVAAIADFIGSVP